MRSTTNHQIHIRIKIPERKENKQNKCNNRCNVFSSFHNELYTIKNILDEKIEQYLSEMDDLLKLNNEDKKLIEAFRTYEEYKDDVSNKNNLLDQMVF